MRRRSSSWCAAEGEARERRSVPLGPHALPDLLGRLAAGSMPPIVAAGVEVPDLVKPHLEAVLEELQRLPLAEISGVNVLAAALDRSTAIVVVPRGKVGAALAALAIPRVTAELATPVPLGRVRIVLLGPGDALHVAGVQLAQLGRGGERA